MGSVRYIVGCHALSTATRENWWIVLKCSNVTVDALSITHISDQLASIGLRVPVPLK